MVMGFIAIGLLLFFLFVLVYLIVISIKPRKDDEGRTILAQSNLHHMQGLPLAVKTFWQVYLVQDTLIIKGGGNQV